MNQWMTQVVPERGLAPDRDWGLLRQYVEHGREDAFTDLVAIYAPLVYSAARRQTSNATLAEEVTQAVFVLLAQKASKLQPGVVLAAWLYQATRYTAMNVRKAEARRQKHERRAARMNPETGGDLRHANTIWQELEGLLDEGVSRLGAKDREAILLRFFQRLSLEDVGRALGVSGDAAQMRVSRALDKLRAFFGQRGVRLPAEALANVLLVNAVRANPARLAPLLKACTVRALAKPAAGAAAQKAAEVARAMARAQARRVATAFVSSSAAAVLMLLLIHAAVTRPPRQQQPQAPRPEQPERAAVASDASPG